MFKSAGIVPVRFTDQGPEFLMLRAWNYWDFPKGKVDPGEDHITAALREADEEAGIKGVDFIWGDQYVETGAYKTKVEGKSAKKIARYYVAEHIKGEITILPNPESGIVEHEEFRWMAFDKIMEDLELSPRILAVLNWANLIVNGVEND
jgi:bis(5'-nucleosidyl)-tetraphosphatase